MSAPSIPEEVRQYEEKPRSIKFHVARFLRAEGKRFAGRRVLDLPAGNGLTSLRLLEAGARPLPFDLFPEYFQVSGLECTRADLSEGIPLEDASVDDAFCQEGLEHFHDQFGALCEFNRVLRPGGSLFLTTPNYSNLQARLSYLLAESERSGSIPPPNELDSVWMKGGEGEEAFYFGHVFLIGIQRLRVLARLSGFRVARVLPTRVKNGSLLLFPFAWPFILLSNAITRWKNRRKFPGDARRAEVYDELFRLGTSPRVLLHSHLFLELEKECDWREIPGRRSSVQGEFGVT